MNPPSDRQTPTRVTDPRAVAAITHPVRMRLLGELARRGSARVVDLASLVGEPPNSVSFHLRQLAKYGLIEQDPDHVGDRRERWWRQASDNGFHIDIESIRLQDGGESAVTTLRRVAEGHVVALHRAIHGGDAAAPRPQAISQDFAVWLDEQELAEMRAELDEVLERWSERSRGNADAEGQGERRGYYGVVMAASEDEIFRVYAEQERA